MTSKKSLSVKLLMAISLLCFLLGCIFLALPQSLTKEVFATEGDPVAQIGEKSLFDFSTNPLENGWTQIDNDGDGRTWEYVDGKMVSKSYDSVTSQALNADNYLISPKISIPANMSATLTWKAKDTKDYNDYYEVRISKVEPIIDDFKYHLLFSGNVSNSWKQETVDLSEYAGKNNIYIAFRHNDSNKWSIELDDVEIKVYKNYTSLADAIDNAKNNETITLLANNEEEIAISKAITFSIDRGSFSFNENSIVPASGLIDIKTSTTGTKTTFTVTKLPDITVYEEASETQINAPIYTLGANVKESAAQYVLPASQLTSIKTGKIKALTYYVNPAESGTNISGPTYAGYLMEVETEKLSDFIDFSSATKVFEGYINLSNNNSELVIKFDEPYIYGGGNLAIAFVCTGSSSSDKIYYYSVDSKSGIDAEGGLIYRDDPSGGVSVVNYIPKTSLSYVHVAQIDNNKYISLEEAINAVENGDTITLLDDCAENVVVNKSLSFTLDTNGKSFTGSINADSEGTCTTSTTDLSTNQTLYTIALHSHEGLNFDFHAWDGGINHNSLPTIAGNYVLANDITLTETWSVPNGTTNLCLNGHVINANCTEDNKFSVITINSGATLNLYDCDLDKDTPTSHNGYVDEDGLWHLGTGSGTAKAITGGIITGGNTTLFGGGVNIGASGTFNMFGGTIAGNKALSYGGGVNNEGTFTMTGGEISYNCTYGGGGVYNSGTFIMTDGEISHNYADFTGGGVDNSGTFTMSGGLISENYAAFSDDIATIYNGGGVYNSGSFTMIGGEIKNNKANSEGGGVAHLGTTLCLGGSAVIANNTIGEFANNLYLCNGKTITLATGENTPTENMNIGITLKNGTGYFATDVVNADYLNCFTSDNKSFVKKARGVGDPVSSYSYTLEKKVTVADGIENGTVTVDLATAILGETVTITANPADNCALNPALLKATYYDGEEDVELELTALANNTYTFIMPVYKVTITAEFALPQIHDNITFIKWFSNNSLPTTAGNYVLTCDVNITASWTVTNEINLCLDGYNILRNGGNCITIDGGKLTIFDCSNTQHKFKEITGESYSKGLWVLDETNGTKIVTGGCIIGSEGNANGMGVYIKNSGSLTLNAGNIVGNYSSQNGGAGVYVDGGTFIMNGGSVCGNKAGHNGGGVYVSGTFAMKGGTITGNISGWHGGGVWATGTITMNDGTISGNTAGLSGGGLRTEGTFNMYKGTIAGNKASGSDGGGGLYATSTINMYGGTISGNSAKRGGGVYAQNNFNMFDGHIDNNKADPSNGGGVYIVENKTFNMQAGSINYNTASGSGGGVYFFKNGHFIMIGGEIKNNSSGGIVNGEITLGGSAVVTDNSSGNVRLPSGTIITLGDGKSVEEGGNGVLAPTEDMLVGVSCLGIFTSAGTSKYFANFFADDANYGVCYSGTCLAIGYKIINNCPQEEEEVDGCYISLNKSVALQGESVTINIIIGTGYKLNSLTATYIDVNGKIQNLGPKGVVAITHYSITMPAFPVTVSAEFEKLPVAQIGDAKYTYLQAAIDAVKNNETITLLANNTETIAISQIITFSIDADEFEFDADNNIIAGVGYYRSRLTTDNVTTYTFKQLVTVPTIESKVYTGETFTADVEESDFYIITENNGGTDAGDYNVKLKLKTKYLEHYKWANSDDQEITLTFKITQAENTWKTEPSIASWTYGETASTPTTAVATFGEVVVFSYKVKGSDDSTYIATKPTTAGTYVMKATVAGTDNYKELSKEVEFTIAQKVVGLTWLTLTAEQLVYSGTAKTLTATATGLVDGDKCDVNVALTTDNDNTNVGTFTFTATGLSNDNYKLPDNVTSPEYKITKAKLTITVKDVTITYGGTAVGKGYTYEGFVGNDNESVITGTPSYRFSKYTSDKVGQFPLGVENLEAQNYDIIVEWGLLYVLPKEVELVWTQPENLVYDGNQKIPTVTVKAESLVGEDTCTVIAGLTSGKDNINVGKFTFTATGLSNNNYKLPENATSPEYIITSPAAIDITNAEVVYEDSKVYNGQTQTFAVTSVIIDGVPATFDVTNNTAKDYSETGYTLIITGSGNFTGTITKTFRITKATYNMTNAKWNYTGAFTYDNSEKTVEVTNLPEGVTAKSYVDNAKTEAGNYTASVIFNYDTTNYNEPTISNLSWTINKATYNMSGITFNNATYTYNGKQKTLEISGTLPTGVSVAYSTNTLTNVGSVTVIATFTSDNKNYNEIPSKTATLEIIKASLTVTIADKTSVYGANLVELTSSVTSGTLYEGDNLNIVLTKETGTDVGTYAITGTYNNTNYDVTFVDGTYTITQATGVITVDTTTITKTYGESITFPTATSNFGTVVCDKIASNLVDAGTYEVKFTLTRTNNYTGDEKTLTIVINKAQVAKPSEDTTNFVYNGQAQTYTLTENANYTISNNVQTNAGTYEVKVSLNNKTNYEWSDGTQTDLTFSFVITQATNEILTLSLASWNYGETANTPSATAKFGEVELVYSKSSPRDFSITTLPTEAGKYIVKAYVVGNENYASADKELEFSINQRASDVKVQDANGNEIQNPPASIISAENGLDPNAVFVVSTISSEDTEEISEVENVLNNILNSQKIVAVYDIKIKVENVEKQPNGNITIKMKVPTELLGKNFVVFHIHSENDIQVITNTNVDENGFITITTNKLSQFAFVTPTEATNNTTTNNTMTIVIIAGAVVVLGAVITTIVCISKRKAKFEK